MSATIQQQLPKPDQMIDLVATAAAVHLAMTGKFDDRIAELKQALASLDEKTVIAATLDEAAKIREDASAYDTQIRQAANEIMKKAQADSDAISARETAVATREQAVAPRETAVGARQAALDNREAMILAAQKQRNDALDARENDLTNGEADLFAERKQLAADQVAFNQKLEALKV